MISSAMFPNVALRMPPTWGPVSEPMRSVEAPTTQASPRIDAAEAMIRKASALRPDDASITDSLGWALYKRGRLPEAIETLRKAAAGDPAQSEIHEHLGDALFASGRRIEARFSWQAALLNAEGKAKSRIEGKLQAGLSPANAAP